MRVLYRVLGSACIVAAGTAQAAAEVAPPGGDPLQSPTCQQALGSLQVDEAAALESRRADPDRPPRSAPAGLLAARRRAGEACLVQRGSALAPAGRLAQPPHTVADVAPDAWRMPMPAAPALPAPPVPPTPLAPAGSRPGPASVLTCDGVGCWADDGTRLQRMEPNLWGPRGICTTLGAIVQCPP